MAGKYSKFNQQFPLKTVLILGAVFLLLKPIIKMFNKVINGVSNGVDLVTSITDSVGITDNADIKKYKAAVENTTSFWYADFWKKAPKGAHLMTYANCEALFNDLSKCWGYFSDDFSKVKNLFVTRITHQSSFSFFCDHVLKHKGFSLNDYLLGGIWPNDRLNKDEVSQIHNIILGKPKY